MQKSRLIEKIAELIQTKKLPMLDDVRDESAEDIRLVLVPKSQNVEDELLMETLFRQSDLEIRFAMNMNVLDNGLVPKVMNLKDVLQAWLTHRQVVLVRRSTFRLDKVVNRIEVLEGYLIVYLNIDKVIKIIRTKDEPKEELMKAFKLTEMQAEAILNMRLRSLRKLEEIELRREHDDLSKERDFLQALIKSEAKQWKEIRKQVGEIKRLFGEDTKLGARRTKIAKAPALQNVEALAEALQEAMTEKEPITVICSAKGWIRAMKGHGQNASEFKYKEGDSERFVFEAQTNDKLMVFGTNGRFYTVNGDKLPPGRGFGEPVRLMVDLPNDAEIAALFVYNPATKLLIVSDDGRGFIVPGAEILAQTRAGKQILNVDAGTEARLCLALPANADHLAIIGENRKMLVFPLAEIPEMAKGKGVILQKFANGGVSDAKAFNWKEGLTFLSRGSEKKVDEIKLWLGKRAQAGRLPPNGFSKNSRFG